MRGLRERKKQRTRQAIAEAALRLFIERGFEQVTVAEVAAAAEVAEKTVFNYFPTKEDLFFAEAAAMDNRLIVDAIRERAPGESPLDALRRLLTDQPAFETAAGQPDPDSDRFAPVQVQMHQQAMWVLQRSPALRAHLRELFARLEASIAELLAEETAARPESVEPKVAAAALVGVIRAVTDRFLTQAAAAQNDQDRQNLLATLAEDTEQALNLLERGLGDYATASPRRQPAAGDTETGPEPQQEPESAPEPPSH
jgi:AcrR family transcriptional regulator